METILCSWLGHTDILASRGENEAGRGPIAEALRAHPFSLATILVSRDFDKDGAAYRKWLTTQITGTTAVCVVETGLEDPTDSGPAGFGRICCTAYG